MLLAPLDPPRTLGLLKPDSYRCVDIAGRSGLCWRYCLGVPLWEALDLPPAGQRLLGQYPRAGDFRDAAVCVAPVRNAGARQALQILRTLTARPPCPAGMQQYTEALSSWSSESCKKVKEQTWYGNCNKAVMLLSLFGPNYDGDALLRPPDQCFWVVIPKGLVFCRLPAALL